MTDQYNGSEDEIRQHALDSAKSREEIMQDYIVEDVEVKLKETKTVKVYEVTVLGSIPVAPKIAEYYVEIDPETKNPTGNVCWAYYPEDRPAVGTWLKVKETERVDNAR